MKKLLLLVPLFLLTACPKKPVAVAPPPAPVVEAPPVEVMPEEFVSVPEVKPVYFEFDKYYLTAEAKDTLSKNAAFLKENPVIQVLVEGHCCECGSHEYNMALGEKRASTIREYYIALGIPSARILTISYGEEKPAIPNACPFGDTPEGAKNRRGETKVKLIR